MKKFLLLVAGVLLVGATAMAAELDTANVEITMQVSEYSEITDLTVQALNPIVTPGVDVTTDIDIEVATNVAVSLTSEASFDDTALDALMTVTSPATPYIAGKTTETVTFTANMAEEATVDGVTYNWYDVAADTTVGYDGDITLTVASAI